MKYNMKIDKYSLETLKNYEFPNIFRSKKSSCDDTFQLFKNFSTKLFEEKFLTL